MQYNKGFTHLASIRLKCVLELPFPYCEKVNTLRKFILQMKKEELLAETGVHNENCHQTIDNCRCVNRSHYFYP
jgi:hypothetical protein